MSSLVLQKTSNHDHPPPSTLIPTMGNCVMCTAPSTEVRCYVLQLPFLLIATVGKVARRGFPPSSIMLIFGL